MTIEAWLDHAVADATNRGLPELRPLLEGLARAVATLRAADWNENVAGPAAADPPPDVR